MLEGYYGKEPFDLRLTVFRMLYKLPVIAAVTLAGTLVFGGIYYVKNVLLQREDLYSATSIYHIDFDVKEEKDVLILNINETSWNDYVKTGLFLDAVRIYLAEQTAESGESAEWSDDELAEMLQVHVPSDPRVVHVTAVTDSPEKSILLAQAVEKAMTQDFAEAIREVLEIKVIDHGDNAQEVIPDVRVGRAFALSAVLTCFFALVFLLLKELGDDNIWLPSTIEKRYGLKVAGTIGSKALAENMKYFFRGNLMESRNARVAVCGVQESVDGEEVLEKLRQTCPDAIGTGWFAVSSPIAKPEVCEKLRGTDGILLVVQAGGHAGRQMEYILEYLAGQDCVGQKDGQPVAAVLLWQADERLIRSYYGFGWKRKER